MVVELRVDEGEEDLTMSAPSHIIISLFFFFTVPYQVRFYHCHAKIACHSVHKGCKK